LSAAQDIAAELERLKRDHRHRVLVPADGIDFTSNDYLGLARHPALREAAMEALNQDGAMGARGSRLLRGHCAAHAKLETFAAQFFGTEKSLFFGSGFLANFALFSTLLGRHDVVIFDERIHASVKEGIHASPAQRYRARHNDPASFDEMLRRASEHRPRRVLLAVESVYSMDGDLAPLQSLLELTNRYGATLVIDEAHATGIFGARGRGLAEALPKENIICIHTCGKSLGVSGALVCASSLVIDYLINKARPFIYSTAPPAFLAATVQRALELVDEEPWRRKRLLDLAALARKSLPGVEPVPSGSQIIPVILGEAERALRVAQALQRAGFDVRAIRPPTVPEGTSRLRVSIHADHSESEISALAAALDVALAAP
jgi:8-amino-7-oxononanoate synthase